MILALETSCDDTCAAVVGHDGRIVSNVISSQAEHDRFGGVVPEVAGRHHVELVNAVVDEALDGVGWDAVDLVAATRGPGLVGALLVGLSTGKGLAAVRGLPFAPVDHLQGHVAANFLGDDPLEPPFLCLVASGGHTFLAHVREHDGFEVLGATLDDAAGEAFDKGARMLGGPFPGGRFLQDLAVGGDPEAVRFPRAEKVRGLDFSFAGVKTSLLYKLREPDAPGPADLAASYQAALVDQLVRRVERALERTGLDRLAIGGGVAANGPLRERIAALGVPFKVPALDLCTDNAAMIASAARYVEPLAFPDYLTLDAYATGAHAL